MRKRVYYGHSHQKKAGVASHMLKKNDFVSTNISRVIVNYKMSITKT